MISINSHALANEVSDDKRFVKSFTPSLYEVRNLIGDGLFTVMRPCTWLKLSVTDDISRLWVTNQIGVLLVCRGTHSRHVYANYHV